MKKVFVIYRNTYQFSGYGTSQATRKVLTENGPTAVPLKWDSLEGAEAHLETIPRDDHGYYSIEQVYYQPNQWEKSTPPTK